VCVRRTYALRRAAWCPMPPLHTVRHTRSAPLLPSRNTRLAGRVQALPSQSRRTTMRPRRPQSPWPLPPRLSCRPLHLLCASRVEGGAGAAVVHASGGAVGSGGGCKRGMSVSGGGRTGRSAGVVCAMVECVILAVVHMLVTLCQRAFCSWL